MAETALAQVIDAIDIETFVVCSSEAEGRKIVLQLMQEMGLKDNDIVYLHYTGPGVRVRARGYINRPGSHYGWLQGDKRVS
jgi:alkyl hydroperoxide reductase subunit AhpF